MIFSSNESSLRSLETMFENISAGTEKDTSKDFKSVSVPKLLPD